MNLQFFIYTWEQINFKILKCSEEIINFLNTQQLGCHWVLLHSLKVEMGSNEFRFDQIGLDGFRGVQMGLIILT